MPIMREGKTPIARCGDVGKYQTLSDIDKKGTRVIVDPSDRAPKTKNWMAAPQAAATDYSGR
jgi:hypothetical protein